MRKTSLDFLVIGAQKAGTTSLFEYLRTHPDVSLPPGKERPFFSKDRVCERGWEEYVSRTFHGASARRLWGTVTPQYMSGAVSMSRALAQVDEHRSEAIVPRRIRKHLPQVKLIALLRDPVSRCISHIRMNVLTGLERRASDEAVMSLLSPEALAAARRHPRDENAAVVWGEYGRILTGYFEEFPREQILVLFTEELHDRPRETMRRILRFLGVDSDFVPPNLGQRYREASTSVRYTWLRPDKLRSWLASVSVARHAWRTLPRPGRLTIERWFIEARYRVGLWNRQPGVVTPVPSPQVCRTLARHYFEDARVLSALTGDRVPWDHPVADDRSS